MIEVIVTNYNSGHFATTAFQSLESQSMRPDKIIVVDDCSTDDSVDKIKREAKHLSIPWSVHVTDKNHGGPAKARNLGLAQTRGDILCLLDIDDWYSPTKIEKSVEILQKHPIIGLVYTDYIMEMIKDGRSVHEFKHPYDFSLLAQTCIVSTNSIGRTDWFKRVGGWHEGLKIADDYHMWVKLAKVSILYHIAEALFHYRVHENSLTQTKADLMQNEIEFIKKDLL